MISRPHGFETDRPMTLMKTEFLGRLSNGTSPIDKIGAIKKYPNNTAAR